MISNRKMRLTALLSLMNDYVTPILIHDKTLILACTYKNLSIINNLRVILINLFNGI